MATTEVKEAAEILEEVSDVIEDTLDLMEAKVSWLKTTNAKMLLVGVSALALGAGASYLISAKRAQAKYQALADEQIADVKRRYSIIRKDDASLEELASKYEDTPEEREAREVEAIAQTNGYVSYERVKPSADAIVKERVAIQTVEAPPAPAVETNVFDTSVSATSNFDYETEVAWRLENPDKPFIITKEEFFEGELDYHQVTLTYYEGDGVLADEQSEPVQAKESTVGVGNLERFGYGSDDPNVVYIRNPKLEVDIEVNYSNGKFAKEVLGFNDSELQHSERRPRRVRTVRE